MYKSTRTKPKTPKKPTTDELVKMQAQRIENLQKALDDVILSTGGVK